ncbi:hypothetical protein HK105_202528 [Polyrhizophydium stewartii]|uniref:Uncharacterized protein n=1 Tax=Polyrhizophydium stewartii TaxID=2732419 RepID=A0ABR4NF03_9FUNG
MAASVLGNLPGATMHSYLGSLIGDIAGTDGYTVPLKTKLLTALLSACFCTSSVVFITVVSRRALRNAVTERPPSPDRQRLFNSDTDSPAGDIADEASSGPGRDANMDDAQAMPSFDNTDNDSVGTSTAVADRSPDASTPTSRRVIRANTLARTHQEPDSDLDAEPLVTEDTESAFPYRESKPESFTPAETRALQLTAAFALAALAVGIPSILIFAPET